MKTEPWEPWRFSDELWRVRFKDGARWVYEHETHRTEKAAQESAAGYREDGYEAEVVRYTPDRDALLRKAVEVLREETGECVYFTPCDVWKKHGDTKPACRRCRLRDIIAEADRLGVGK